MHPSFQEFLNEQDFPEDENLSANTAHLDEPRDYLSSAVFLKYFSTFLKQRSEEDKTFTLWWTYIDMVLTLLMFTRGIRGGDWESYCGALADMLPYIALYDHGNYLKSLSVYIADMQQLPEEVEAGFRLGDFAVLRTKKKFCQVDPDHAQEWIVGTCKSNSGGILGITQDARTLQRWALSLHFRSEISEKTYAIFEQAPQKTCPKEETGPRRTRDIKDEEAIMQVMETYNLGAVNSSSTMSNVANKDIATPKITEALLTAKQRGIELVENFAHQRLVISQDTGTTAVSYHATLPKNKSLTLDDLYKEKHTQESNKKEVMKTDRDCLHILIAAYEGGRHIDLRKILNHELCKVPISLASMNGELRSAEKASLVKEILKSVECPSNVLSSLKSNSILIIDGMAFVLSMGRPNLAETFGDYADCFIKRILSFGSKYQEVHVLFDRYRPLSIKAGTRKKRAKGFAPVRRDITDCNVPLPKNWSNFLLLSENKADLCRFLSEQILQHEFFDFEVVLSGGFKIESHVQSTNPARNVECLKASHEEADTRMILHAVHSEAQNIIVMTRDTDVVFLLAYHFAKMKCSHLWVMSGTARDIKFIPVHDLWNTLAPEQVTHLLAFHAITGCDSTSKLASVTKVGAWKFFSGENCKLLSGLGCWPIDKQVLKNVEKFVVQLYKVDPGVECADDARSILFAAVKKPENLPPTTDALRLHIKRCHYQVCVLENAHIATPSLPCIEDCGWIIDDAHLVPLLMTLDPNPTTCPEFFTCHCKGFCNTKNCSCRKSNVPCIKLCRPCKSSCLN